MASVPVGGRTRSHSRGAASVEEDRAAALGAPIVDPSSDGKHSHGVNSYAQEKMEITRQDVPSSKLEGVNTSVSQLQLRIPSTAAA